jgi:hypothetical protein
MALERRPRGIRKLVEESRAAEETAAGSRTWAEEFETSVQAFRSATALKINLLDKCTLCRRFLTPQHLQSGRHIQKLIVSAELDLFAGPVERIRVLGELMATSPEMTPTRRRCRDFWGSRLEHSPRRARDKLIKVGHFTEQRGRSYVYHSSDIVFELGMATYSGSGKYTDDDVVVFWSNIPEDADAESEPVCSRTARWWPIVCVNRRRERIDVSGEEVLVMSTVDLLWDKPFAWWVRVASTEGV